MHRKGEIKLCIGMEKIKICIGMGENLDVGKGGDLKKRDTCRFRAEMRHTSIPEGPGRVTTVETYSFLSFGGLRWRSWTEASGACATAWFVEAGMVPRAGDSDLLVSTISRGGEGEWCKVGTKVRTREPFGARCTALSGESERRWGSGEVVV